MPPEIRRSRSAGAAAGSVLLQGALALALTLALAAVPLGATEPPPGKTTAQVLEQSKPSDWRPLDPDSTLYLTLPGGRVVIELAPEFAPLHVANIRQLVRQKYFDGLAVVRSQDNYVVQWGDPAAEDEDGGDGDAEEESGGAGKRRSLGEAKATLPPEMDRPIAPPKAEAGSTEDPAQDPAEDQPPLPFTPLGDPDVYAPEVGFTHGLPVARDPSAGRTWLAHCYAMVGVGRGDAADSGSGAELYVVIGHSPRHLDRNVTLVGRVVQGMEVLSTLPRGTGALGFYEDPAENVPITSIRLGSELPEAERAHFEVLRTDTQTFRDLIDARRWRREGWFLDKVGHVSLCNVPLPVRPIDRGRS